MSSAEARIRAAPAGADRREPRRRHDPGRRARRGAARVRVAQPDRRAVPRHPPGRLRRAPRAGLALHAALAGPPADAAGCRGAVDRRRHRREHHDFQPCQPAAVRHPSSARPIILVTSGLSAAAMSRSNGAPSKNVARSTSHRFNMRATLTAWTRAHVDLSSMAVAAFLRRGRRPMALVTGFTAREAQASSIPRLVTPSVLAAALVGSPAFIVRTLSSTPAFTRDRGIAYVRDRLPDSTVARVTLPFARTLSVFDARARSYHSGLTSARRSTRPRDGRRGGGSAAVAEASVARARRDHLSPGVSRRISAPGRVSAFQVALCGRLISRFACSNVAGCAALATVRNRAIAPGCARRQPPAAVPHHLRRVVESPPRHRTGCPMTLIIACSPGAAAPAAAARLHGTSISALANAAVVALVTTILRARAGAAVDAAFPVAAS